MQLLDSYGQIRPRDRRALARSVALDALSLKARLTGSTRTGLTRNRVHFVYLHQVFDDEAVRFRTLLRSLSQTHKFVLYSEAVHRLRSGEIDAPYMTFSFDDGLKNGANAARLLEEFGASACFFVNPGMIGETAPVRLAEFSMNALNMPPTGQMEWADLEKLLNTGHEVGNRSLSHVDMATMDRSRLDDEVGKSLEILSTRLGPIQHFAWPYGRFVNFSSDAADAVYEAGHISCASAVRGGHVSRSSRSRFCIRRDHVIAAWPVRHTRYLIGASANKADESSDGWPDEWQS